MKKLLVIVALAISSVCFGSNTDNSLKINDNSLQAQKLFNSLEVDTNELVYIVEDDYQATADLMVQKDFAVYKVHKTVLHELTKQTSWGSCSHKTQMISGKNRHLRYYIRSVNGVELKWIRKGLLATDHSMGVIIMSFFSCSISSR